MSCGSKVKIRSTNALVVSVKFTYVLNFFFQNYLCVKDSVFSDNAYFECIFRMVFTIK